MKFVNHDLWLVGTGQHSQCYIEVLNTLDKKFSTIGRSKEGCKNLFEKTGIISFAGGISQALKQYPAPKVAIICVSYHKLADVAIELMRKGTKKILLEKPGALTAEEGANLLDKSKKYKSNIFVAYNRRFYQSVMEARKMINEDGGIISCNFEFTEWIDTIEFNKLHDVTLRHWAIANSSHIMDLAFSICGLPKQLNCYTSGSLPWHPSASRFVGSGITVKEINFSYQADWEAPGRWNVEFLTRKNRYIFSPLEKLKLIKKNETNIKSIEIDDKLDTLFKPGLFLQTSAFLKNDLKYLCTLEEQLKTLVLVSQMAGYQTSEHKNS